LSVNIETNLLSLISLWLDKFCQVPTKVLQKFFSKNFGISSRPKHTRRTPQVLLSHARRPKIPSSGIVQATKKGWTCRQLITYDQSRRLASCQHRMVAEALQDRSRIRDNKKHSTIKRAMTAVKVFTEYLQILEYVYIGLFSRLIICIFQLLFSARTMFSFVKNQQKQCFSLFFSINERGHSRSFSWSAPYRENKFICRWDASHCSLRLKISDIF
jgi:hypothetical protein